MLETMPQQAYIIGCQEKLPVTVIGFISLIVSKGVLQMPSTLQAIAVLSVTPHKMVRPLLLKTPLTMALNTERVSQCSISFIPTDQCSQCWKALHIQPEEKSNQSHQLQTLGPTTATCLQCRLVQQWHKFQVSNQLSFAWI